MKLGIVVPRYGGEAIGGAEKAMRMIGERLVARERWQVEVFTTCAKSAITWEDEETPGDSVSNGVVIHRYRSLTGRDGASGPVAKKAERPLSSADRTGEDLFIDQQGPVCPDVIDAAEASDNDLVAFSPYLFYPAVRGVPRLADRSVLHGAAHDEPALHMAVMEPMYSAAAGLSYYTDAERMLTERLFSVAHKPRVVLGLGIETTTTTRRDRDVREAFGLGDRRYVVCVGRVENGKGARALDGFFREYKRRKPSDLALVFVGPANEKLDQHRDIIVTDTVDEATKYALVAGADVSISPSAMESFSMVVLEAWDAGTPVLVNSRCGATVEHASRSGGGLWFDGYVSFEVALDRLLDDDEVRARLAERGLAYLKQHFSWDAVLDRYVTFCAQILAHRS